jgi:hypothetical protein
MSLKNLARRSKTTKTPRAPQQACGMLDARASRQAKSVAAKHQLFAARHTASTSQQTAPREYPRHELPYPWFL